MTKRPPPDPMLSEVQQEFNAISALLAQSDAATRRAWKKFRTDQTAKVLKARLP